MTFKLLNSLAIIIHASGGTICTEEQFNNLGYAYLEGQRDMQANNVSVVDRLDEFNYVYANLTEEQKAYPCLECFRNYTSNLYDVMSGDACTSAPFGDQCLLDRNELQQEFVDCSVSGSSSPGTGWISLAIMTFVALLTN
jgi:hypothetical protein